jgi:signal peptidase II
MRSYVVFALALTGWLIVDQNIKALFVEGFYAEGACIDWVLHYNEGVAFSMFDFLGDALKWLQALLIAVMVFFFFKERWIVRFPSASAMIFAGALSNLYDRFTHGAVVDYVAWHCGFRWPVFNLADVLIDAGIAWLLWKLWRKEKLI